ncbi:hypothetical protein [Photobacterium phosphoreum]|uniref:hypothetical protein n=1 Tax=Photobacterium phosphoreum TaxID=659 RepID=UPI0039AF0E6A
MAHKKIKKEKTFKLINKIIDHKCPKDQLIRIKIDEFYNFVHNYKHDNYEQVLDVVTKDDDIKSKFAFFQKEKENLLNVTILDVSKLDLNNILSIFKVIFNNNLDELKEFSKYNSEIEWLLTLNKTSDIVKILDYLDDKYRITLWSINLRMICLALDGRDNDELYQLYNEYSAVNDSEFLLDSLECMMARNTVSDVLSHVKTNDNSKVKELNEGNAKQFAAYFSLLSGVSCLDNDVISSYSLPVLTLLPLFDAYRFIIKAISNDFVDHRYEISANISSPLLNFIMSVDKKNELTELNNLKCLLSEEVDGKLDNCLSADLDYINYCKGEYDKVVKRFEAEFYKDKNVISKINLIAKSYIKSERLPGGELPKILSDILVNTIKVYQLNNSNQCIRNILALAYRFNDFELSYHLLVSIVKSAPYYFNEDEFCIISKKALLTRIPVTKLTLKLEDKFIVQNNISDNEKSNYLINKEKLCNELNSGSSSEANIEKLLCLIHNETTIKKDYLELKFEYLMKFEKYDDAIKLASESLTKNRESVFCIPMYKLAELIETGEYVGIDSVIVSHFFESEHRMQSEDLLKDSFEELLISYDDISPSQILDGMGELSEIEIFFFKNVCTTRLISYQGIYETSSELSMERLNILNLLATKNNINNDEVAELIRDCMDEIIIAEGLTRISNSRVNISISELTNSVNDEVKSLIKAYNEVDDEDDSGKIYSSKISDDHFFAKGEKNAILKKIFNLLRLEFIDNPDYGLDKILSSRIRHSFFSDEVSRKAIEKKLIVEFDKNGKFEHRKYWMDKYSYVSKRILKDVNRILDIFNNDFYKLIEEAESWMKISKNGELLNSEFDFQLSIDLDFFNDVAEFIEEDKSSDFICNYIFIKYKESLVEKLENMRVKLMDSFCNNMDILFLKLAKDIDCARTDAAFNDLVEAISYVKNGIKEDIKTSSEWFSIDDNHYEERAIEISKLIKISKIFLERSSGQDKGLEMDINFDYLIQSNQTSFVNLSIINLLSNAFKYVKFNTNVYINVSPFGCCGFKMIISNQIEDDVLEELKNGRFDEILKTLYSKSSIELLKTEGGTGLFKSFYELKLASENFDLNLNLEMDSFNVEVTYDE